MRRITALGAFAYLILDKHIHRVLPLNPRSRTDQRFAQLATNVFGRMPREQTKVFNELVGPDPIRVLMWGTLPLEDDRTELSLGAVIQKAAGGKGVNRGRFVGECAGLTTLPLIGLEHLVVKNERTPGGSRRPVEPGSSPALPALPFSLEEIAESAGLLLASRVSALSKDPGGVVAELGSVLGVLHAPIVRQIRTYLATQGGERSGLSAADEEAIGRLNAVIRQLTQPASPEPKLRELAATLGEVFGGEVRALATNKPFRVADLGRTLAQIRNRFASVNDPLVDAVNEFLATLDDPPLASFEAKKAFVLKLTNFAGSLGLRFECSTCRLPSTLVLEQPAGMPLGAFQFRHTNRDGRRTRHGGTPTVPALRLVAPHDR